jgi:AcrR family transcriptional regulator
MIVAIAERLVEQFGEALSRGERHPAGLERLLGSIAFYFDSAARDPVATKALFVLLGDGLSNPLIREPIAQLNASGARNVEAQLKAGIASGRVRAAIDSAALGLLIMAQLRGAVSFWLLSPDDIDLTRIRNEMIAAVTRSLVP